MSSNPTIFSIEPKEGRRMFLFHVHNTPKYGLHYFDGNDRYNFKDLLINKRIEEIETLSEEDEKLPFNVFLACQYIFDKEGFDNELYSYYTSSDTLTLRLTINELTDEKNILLHDDKKNGLFLDPDPDSPIYHATLSLGSAGYHSYDDDSQYVLEYANNKINVHHYILWQNFKPLFTYLRALESYGNEDLSVEHTLEEWLAIQKMIVDLGPVLSPMKLYAFLDSVKNINVSGHEKHEGSLFL